MEDSMKRFSWILALIMALTMAFVFTACPSDPADPGPGPGPGPGGNAFVDDPNGTYTKNVTAEDIDIEFGTSPGQTQINYDRENGTDIGNIGTLAYLSDGSGYTYTYAGSGGNRDYDNIALRFKVPLEDGILLADYGKVTFTWQATSPIWNNGDSVNSYKKLYLVAADDEASIKPYAAGRLESHVVSTSYFKDYADIDTGSQPGKFYAGNSPAPAVNGIQEHNMELPIIAKESLFGDTENFVWVCIYVHAVSGTYTIKDVKFVAGPYVKDPSRNLSLPAAPDKPPVAGIPEGADSFGLTLTDHNYTNNIGETNGGVATVTNNADGSISAEFDTNLQILIIKLTDVQIDKLLGRADDSDFYFVIDGEVVEGDEGTDAFRYYLGRIDTGSGWNGTNGSGNPATNFETILSKSQTYARDEFGYFILQRGGGGATTSGTNTITIRSIDIGVMPGPKSADISVSVGSVAQDTEVKAGTINSQSVKAIENGYSMFYAGNSYGNVMSRFKVNLGTKKLEDFSKVTFTWKGIWGGATSEKNLFLLASSSEAAVTPRLEDAGIRAAIVSVAPGTNLWDGKDGVPNVDGKDEIDVELLLESGDALTGEVWFSIWMNAPDGAYSITNIKFVEKGAVDLVVSNLTIGNLKPVQGKAPVKTITNVQYNGAIVWTETVSGDDLDGNFEPETEYTAVITLTKRSGYTFDGVDADAFAVTGATTTTNLAGDDGNTLVITAEFPATDAIALEPQFFLDAVGLKTGVRGGNVATFDPETGIIDCTNTTSSKLIEVDVPATSAPGTKIIVINYACYLVDGAAQVTLKNGGWGDPENCTGSGASVNFNGLSIYQTLGTTAIGTLLLPEAMYANGKTTISFQVTSNANAFKLKIISVDMVEPGDSIYVKFGTGADETVVTPGNNGTIVTGGGSYTFTYGTDNYGKGVNRFMVDLGDKTLGDFEKVTLTWTGVSGGAASYKNVSLLASSTEAGLTPPIGSGDSDISALVVNASDMNGGPQMNGLIPTSVDLPIINHKDLTGEVWFAIYIHAADGSYSISNLVFVEKEE
jgi:hypothetical protein